MGPVPDNDFYNDPAEDLAQYPHSQDGETLLSNNLPQSFSSRPSDISHIRQALADLDSQAGAMIAGIRYLPTGKTYSSARGTSARIDREHLSADRTS